MPSDRAERLALGLIALTVIALILSAVTVVVYATTPRTPIAAPLPILPIATPVSNPPPATPVRPSFNPGPSPTRSPSPSRATPDPAHQLLITNYQFTLGQSVEGRPLLGYSFLAAGQPSQALVLVCGIHGDEMNAWPILQPLILDYASTVRYRPRGVDLYFIESINPDGAAKSDRLNANDVDLNRNWDTYDWRRGVFISAEDFLPTGGGEEPFSEPETRGMRDWLLNLQMQYPDGVTVIYFHAAVPPDGLITPGVHRVNGEDLADAPSRKLGQLMADAVGYEYSNHWLGGYPVTGDASTWAVAQGLISLTVELPTRDELEPPAALRLREGILAIIDSLSLGF